VQEVSLRACYLFSRLAKLLRQPLARFLPDILASLQVIVMNPKQGCHNSEWLRSEMI